MNETTEQTASTALAVVPAALLPTILARAGARTAGSWNTSLQDEHTLLPHSHSFSCRGT